jgi:ferritin-like protein
MGQTLPSRDFCGTAALPQNRTLFGVVGTAEKCQIRTSGELCSITQENRNSLANSEQEETYD